MRCSIREEFQRSQGQKVPEFPIRVEFNNWSFNLEVFEFSYLQIFSRFGYGQ